MTTKVFEVQEKLASLEKALLEKTPNMSSLLREIHKKLKNDPDIVTVLSDEECKILVDGLKDQTKVNIATQSLTKRSGKKALSKMTVDDL